MKWTSLLFVVAACTVQENGPDDPTAKCDGVLQDDEGAVIDSTFDQDGDGFKDKNVADCHDVYDPDRLDCDDTTAAIRPDALEVQCNDIDDDCNEATDDSFDNDGDGISTCDDCDDSDDRAWPGNEEICWDDVDNDCDQIVDNNCGLNYNGLFTITEPVPHPQYTCFVGAIDVDFDEVTFINIPPALTVFNSHGSQPGIMNGEFISPGEFDLVVENLFTSPVGCDELYRFSGVFTDANTFVATLELEFSGGICFNCANQSYDVVGIRIP